MTLRLRWKSVLERMELAGIRDRVALAEVSGIHKQHLWDLSQGRINVTVSTVGRLATALGCQPGDLLAYSTEED